MSSLSTSAMGLHSSINAGFCITDKQSHANVGAVLAGLHHVHNSKTSLHHVHHLHTQDSGAESYIRFHEDGTGELVARCELCLFIAAHFNWKSDEPDSLTKEIDTATSWLHTWQPRDLAQINIEMTLTTRRVQLGNMDMRKWKINEDILTTEAFIPKKLTLRLQKGKFMTITDARFVSELPCYPVFHYRLFCDPSPFPEQDMWKDAGGAPESIRFWEWRQFQSHQRSVQWQMTLGGKIFNTCKRAIGLD